MNIKEKGLFQIITGLILLSFFLTIIIYLLIIDWFKLQLEIVGTLASPGMYALAAVLLMIIPIMMIGFGSNNVYKSKKRRIMLIKIFLKKFPYICTECGTFCNMKNKYCENCGEKDTLRETLFQDYEQYSEILKEKEEKEFLQKAARKEKELEEKLTKEKEKRELLLKNKSKIEDMIYNYLESNINRAFTAKSIMDRVFSDSFTDVPNELVEHYLENLVKHGKIQRTQKENEIFYFF